MTEPFRCEKCGATEGVLVTGVRNLSTGPTVVGRTWCLSCFIGIVVRGHQRGVIQGELGRMFR